MQAVLLLERVVARMSKKNSRPARRTRKPLTRPLRRLVATAAAVLSALTAAKELWELVEWLADVIGRLR